MKFSRKNMHALYFYKCVDITIYTQAAIIEKVHNRIFYYVCCSRRKGNKIIMIMIILAFYTIFGCKGFFNVKSFIVCTLLR